MIAKAVLLNALVFLLADKDADNDDADNAVIAIP